MAECVTKRSEVYRVNWVEMVIEYPSVTRRYERLEDFDTLDEAVAREVELTTSARCEAVYLYPVVIHD